MTTVPFLTSLCFMGALLLDRHGVFDKVSAYTVTNMSSKRHKSHVNNDYYKMTTRHELSRTQQQQQQQQQQKPQHQQQQQQMMTTSSFDKGVSTSRVKGIMSATMSGSQTRRRNRSRTSTSTSIGLVVVGDQIRCDGSFSNNDSAGSFAKRYPMYEPIGGTSSGSSNVQNTFGSSTRKNVCELNGSLFEVDAGTVFGLGMSLYFFTQSKQSDIADREQLKDRREMLAQANVWTPDFQTSSSLSSKDKSYLYDNDQQLAKELQELLSSSKTKQSSSFFSNSTKQSQRFPTTMSPSSSAVVDYDNNVRQVTAFSTVKPPLPTVPPKKELFQSQTYDEKKSLPTGKIITAKSLEKFNGKADKIPTPPTTIPKTLLELSRMSTSLSDSDTVSIEKKLPWRMIGQPMPPVESQSSTEATEVTSHQSIDANVLDLAAGATTTELLSSKSTEDIVIHEAAVKTSTTSSLLPQSSKDSDKSESFNPFQQMFAKLKSSTATILKADLTQQETNVQSPSTINNIDSSTPATNELRYSSMFAKTNPDSTTSTPSVSFLPQFPNPFKSDKDTKAKADYPNSLEKNTVFSFDTDTNIFQGLGNSIRNVIDKVAKERKEIKEDVVSIPDLEQNPSSSSSTSLPIPINTNDSMVLYDYQADDDDDVGDDTTIEIAEQVDPLFYLETQTNSDSDIHEQSDLDVEAPSDLDIETRNDLAVETHSDLEIQPQSDLEIQQQNYLEIQSLPGNDVSDLSTASLTIEKSLDKSSDPRAFLKNFFKKIAATDSDDPTKPRSSPTQEYPSYDELMNLESRTNRVTQKDISRTVERPDPEYQRSDDVEYVSSISAKPLIGGYIPRTSNEYLEFLTGRIPEVKINDELMESDTYEFHISDDHTKSYAEEVAELEQIIQNSKMVLDTTIINEGESSIDYVTIDDSFDGKPYEPVNISQFTTEESPFLESAEAIEALEAFILQSTVNMDEGVAVQNDSNFDSDSAQRRYEAEYSTHDSVSTDDHSNDEILYSMQDRIKRFPVIRGSSYLDSL